VVEFRISGFAKLSTLRQLWRFSRWCRRERIAVLQTCDFYSNVFGLLGGALAGVPVRIGSRRDLNPGRTDAQGRLQRLAYRFATRVVANSPAAADVLREEGVPSPAISLISNGVDAAAYPEPVPRAELRRVITVANLRPEKNHQVLLGAAARLADVCPGLRYQIVGEGSQRHELEAMARARGVAGIVEFVGHREDVPALLAAADVFVLPSRSEALPNSVIEAMAAGLPVVASAVGGLRNLIEHEHTGILVAPGDAEALADAILAIVREPARARALGSAARRDILARYSFERMVAAFEDLYQSTLGARHGWSAQAAQAGI
jgi:glycosyltransferase involved in cell wall biosynthesis